MHKYLLILHNSWYEFNSLYGIWLSEVAAHYTMYPATTYVHQPHVAYQVPHYYMPQQAYHYHYHEPPVYYYHPYDYYGY